MVARQKLAVPLRDSMEDNQNGIEKVGYYGGGDRCISLLFNTFYVANIIVGQQESTVHNWDGFPSLFIE